MGTQMIEDNETPKEWYLSANGFPKGESIDASGRVVEREDYFIDTPLGDESRRRAELFFESQEKPRRRLFQCAKTEFIIHVFHLDKTNEADPIA